MRQPAHITEAEEGCCPFNPDGVPRKRAQGANSLSCRQCPSNVPQEEEDQRIFDERMLRPPCFCPRSGPEEEDATVPERRELLGEEEMINKQVQSLRRPHTLDVLDEQDRTDSGLPNLGQPAREEEDPWAAHRHGMRDAHDYPPAV